MIKILALAGSAAEVRIFDPIGKDMFGDGLTAKRFDDELKALGEVREITVRINSPGGAVFDGMAIFNTLKAHAARKVVVVEGLAASIASLIAMSGDEIRMATGAMMMVHNPWSLAAGDADAMREAAVMLDKVAGRMRDIYVKRTGLTPARVEELMDAETWLTAEEAVDLGFATSATDDATENLTAAATAALSNFRNIPTQVYAMTTAATATDRTAILAAETNRRQQIRSLFTPFADDQRALLDNCLDDMNCSAEAASARLLAAIAATQVGPLGGGAHERQRPQTTGEFIQAASDALCIRAGVRIEKPHAAARDLAQMRLIDMAHNCLNMAGKHPFRGSPSQVIKAALTTSDFPLLLENVMTKSLRAGFEVEPTSHTLWTKSSTVPDFKTQSRPILGSAPDLAVVVERGEYTYGAMDEDKAAFAVTKYGKMLSVTFEMMVNDDLSAFTVIPVAMAKAARRKEADVVYTDLLLANSAAGQTMQDAATLFHATHGNLIGTGTAISVDSLGVAKTLLRRQKAVGGVGYLNLQPRFLLVPPEKETLAEQILAQLSRSSVSGSNVVHTPSPDWIRQLQVVVEPRLSGNAWYMLADFSQIDICEIARLEGEDGPVIEQNDSTGFGTDSRDYKVRHVFGARFLDWRGIVKNVGA